MSYLSREDRKRQILDTAIVLVLEQGLEALTARSVTARAGTSTGQIHHHYGSLSELQAEVFEAITKRYLEEELPAGLALDEQLLYMLDPGDREVIGPYLRLWSDAEKLIEKNEPLREVYEKALIGWQQLIVSAIESGTRKGERRLKTGTADEAAWRLIAAALGLENLAASRLSVLPDNFVVDALTVFIANELAG
ncbi:TetR family transcriptional regulator [Cedecea lapagei]|uniref:TetR family transcriptional regulator n=1 Tax=Cedecea lapagei TaxID=158823 RepID=A0A447V2N5_9ENTR|nr:TetR family transcriptional regulator [Cedecea lapagei]VEB97636.1 TetR family transcriptional regulator [Cedecea lapagei]